jgi:hypothetical protein
MPGNGLGLSLVSAVAELHGAKLSVVAMEPGLQVRLSFPATGRAPLSVGPSLTRHHPSDGRRYA